jgi:hypothetical protein
MTGRRGERRDGKSRIVEMASGGTRARGGDRTTYGARSEDTTVVTRDCYMGNVTARDGART